MDRNERIEAIYARLPDLDCQKKCAASCGPIPMSRAENARIVEHVGYQPRFDQFQCPMLNAFGRCSVYEVRPAICRLYGVVEAMRCPHGCKPKQWLTDDQARRVLRQLEAVEP